ncbi:MAG TPA: trypsin-like peptidase domain-containing protein [Anaerolineales bacterium]|nr:trypsin-like peptidase domain-containing protein [Anaerolineales bacterium]
MKRLILLVVVLALSSLACQAITGAPGNMSLPNVGPSAVAPAAPESESAQNEVPANVTIVQPPALDLQSGQDTLINLYNQVNQGVVSIQVLTEMGGGLGSGFVIDDQGHIVTNYHVVENVTDLEIGFASGFKARGEVIGTDIDSDLAIVRVNAPPEELHPLPLSDSDLVQVGQTVIAIGNPFGLEGTMTLGIVSGLGRTLRSMRTTADGGAFSAADIIQTDAAINPGNSGGPLVNLAGEVIGVNQSIRTNTFSDVGDPLNSGIGFAIPVNIVKRVAPFLISDGSYDYPLLGISSLNDISLLEQEALGLPRSTGVYVTGVTEGGPADRAGLKAGTRSTSLPGLRAGGDLIISIDGREVNNFNDLIGYLAAYKRPGEVVTLVILRDGREQQVELTLDKRPASQ